MIAIVFLLGLLGVLVFAGRRRAGAADCRILMLIRNVFVIFFGSGVYIAAVLGILAFLTGFIFNDRPWWNFAGQTLWGPSSTSSSSPCRSSC